MRIVDVFVLSRDIISEYKKIHAGTLMHPIDVLGDKGVVSIIGERTKLKIETACLRWSGYMFRAQLRRYGDRANIIYSHELNPCWSRFAICKEAFHLLSGDTKNFSSDPVALVNGLLNQMPQYKVDDDIGEIAAEHLAITGAVQLLLPHEFTPLLDRLESSGKTHYEIATIFKVPEKIISYRLTPDTKAIFKQLEEIKIPN